MTAKRRRRYPNRSSQYNRKVLETLFDAQGGLCASCGLEMFLPMRHPAVENHKQFASIDHLWARRIGGSDDITNLVGMHAICNSSKQHRPPTGCELIFHALVLAKLDMVAAAIATLPPESPRRFSTGEQPPTLADVWPKKADG